MWDYFFDIDNSYKDLLKKCIPIKVSGTTY